MPTDPGTDEDRKKQANKQKSIDNFLNQRKILNDTLTSQSITLWIINIAKRLSSKDYQQKLKDFILEKILRRRRGRGRTLVQEDNDPALITAAQVKLDALTKELEKQSPVLPTSAEGKPEEKQKTLMFSKMASMASFLKQVISTKPAPDGSEKRKKQPKT